jgi:hypothetical protein
MNRGLSARSAPTYFPMLKDAFSLAASALQAGLLPHPGMVIDENQTAGYRWNFAAGCSHCMGYSLLGSHGLELLGIGGLVRDSHRGCRGLWKTRALGSSGRATGAPARRVRRFHLHGMALSLRRGTQGTKVSNRKPR